MAEKNNRIDSRFSVVGAFWTPDSSEEDPDTGTVTSDERQITLTTAPVYKQVSPDDFRNLFSRGETQLIKTVHGFTADGICTLCQLIDVDSLGLTDTRINKAISATVFRVSVCLMGMHIAGLEDRCLDSARYTFSSWHQWLPRYVSETWEKDFVVLKVPMKDMDLVTVDIDDKPIKIRLKLGSELKSAENEAGRLSRSVAFLEVENTDKESLAWYLGIGNRLENLFSLLIGTSLSLQTMFLYRGEESAHVNMKRNSNPGTFDYQDCVRCSPGQIGTAMKIWLTEDERFHSVESLALGVLRKGKLFVETEFLSLAQALEGFHRATTNATSSHKAIIRQVRKKISALIQAEDIDEALKTRICESVSHANEPTMASRLADLCDRLSTETLSKMKLDPRTFIRDVVVTRNFYTHAGGKQEHKRTPHESKDLFLLNQKMRALLRGVMLRRLEVPEQLLIEPLVREATRWH